MIARWTLKELYRARARVLGSVLAVGAAFVLVIMFRAVWEGEAEQLAVYLEGAGADIWVMQDDVSNMHMASSFISDGKRVEIGRLRGVRSVTGILYLNTLVEVGGQSWFSYLVGLDERDAVGGPWSMADGTKEVFAGGAVIPETLGRLTGVGLGDSIRVADRTLEITGLSRETFSVVNPVTFVSDADLSSVLGLAGYDSYVLVQADAGRSPKALAEQIEAEVDGVAALTTPELVANDLQLASQMGIEVIALMTLIGAALAAVLVAFALFIHTAHVRRALVILKALGFSDRHLYGSVLIQAALITGAAFAGAVVVVSLAAIFGPRLAPILSLSVRGGTLVQIGATGLIVGLLAALPVARRVARIDPMSAFRE